MQDLRDFPAMNNSLEFSKIQIIKIYENKITDLTAPIGNTGITYDNYDYIFIKLNVNLPAPVSSYSSVNAEFYFDGKADDGFRFYLNNTKIDEKITGWTPRYPGDLTNINNWNRTTFSKTINLSSQNSKLAISNYSYSTNYGAYVWTSYLRVKTVSK